MTKWRCYPVLFLTVVTLCSVVVAQSCDRPPFDTSCDSCYMPDDISDELYLYMTATWTVAGDNPVICFGPGYFPSIGTTATFNSLPLIDYKVSMTFKGAGETETILDCNYECRLLSLWCGITVTITDLTMLRPMRTEHAIILTAPTNSHAVLERVTLSEFDNSSYSAVLVYQGTSLSLTNVTIREINSNQYSGVVEVLVEATTDVIISGCLFENVICIAECAISQRSRASGSIVVTDTVFRNISSRSIDAAPALISTNGRSIVVDRCSFVDNFFHAAMVGGCCGTVNLTITNSFFDNNVGLEVDSYMTDSVVGCANLYPPYNGVYITVAASTIVNTQNGNGLYVGEYCTAVTLESVLIANNHHGIYLLGSVQDLIAAENALVCDNTVPLEVAVPGIFSGSCGEACLNYAVENNAPFMIQPPMCVSPIPEAPDCRISCSCQTNDECRDGRVCASGTCVDQSTTDDALVDDISNSLDTKLLWVIVGGGGLLVCCCCGVAVGVYVLWLRSTASSSSSPSSSTAATPRASAGTLASSKTPNHNRSSAYASAEAGGESNTNYTTVVPRPPSRQASMEVMNSGYTTRVVTPHGSGRGAAGAPSTASSFSGSAWAATSSTVGGSMVFEGMGEATEVARGGQAVVYTAFCFARGETVCLKVFFQSSSFEREVSILKTLKPHPNIIQPIWLSKGVPPNTLVMAVATKGSLPEYLKTNPVAGQVAAVTGLAVDIADGLSFLHSAGVSHLDVKPANVLLTTSDSGSVRAMLTDFGSAFLKGRGDLRVDMCTVKYAAPEVLRMILGEPIDSVGIVSYSSLDVYSFGVTLWEIACGKEPHGGKSNEAVSRAVVADPLGARVAAGLVKDKGLAAIVELCTRLSDDRPRGIDAILNQLRELRG